MQNLEDLKEKIFFEAKNILDTLSKINSADEFLMKKDLIEELSERVSFLKVLEKNENYFESNELGLITDNQVIESVSGEQEPLQVSEVQHVEEEVLFTNELNEIHKDDLDDSESIEHFETIEIAEEVQPEVTFAFQEEQQVEEHPIETPIFSENELQTEIADLPESEDPLILNDAKEDEYLNAIEEKEKAFEELEEKRIHLEEVHQQEIISDEYEEIEIQIANETEDIPEEKLISIQEEHRENAKKFRLAHIKGLNSVQSLFDDDSFENSEAPAKKQDLPAEEPSLLKTNVPTDYMEAEKRKPEFKLDLNDRLAFTKTLFSGSQAELNETIRTLNGFKTLDEAKEYLSDLYYDKNWEKVDEYAQRLWSLVENKFL